MIPPERLPDGRIDEVRFLVVSKHAAKGHRTAMNVCTQGACPQYREQYATIATLRAALDRLVAAAEAFIVAHDRVLVDSAVVTRDDSYAMLNAVDALRDALAAAKENRCLR